MEEGKGKQGGGEEGRLVMYRAYLNTGWYMMLIKEIKGDLNK